ncbi:MAG: FMN-binding protein [Verrucomicrobiae bacterium]|nr:FMN-binding protein [Verrucomicrobiae bacterium]
MTLPGRRTWQSRAVPLFRMALLVAAVFLARVQHGKVRAARSEQLPLSLVRQQFEDAERVLPSNDDGLLQEVVDSRGERVGYVFKTSPTADAITGYSGPTNTMVCLDEDGQLFAAEILWSEDTPDHVEAVARDRAFWSSLNGIRLGEGGTKDIDAVSGATLTSRAISQGVLKCLEAGELPQLFPEPVGTAEVTEFLPTASELEVVGVGHWRVRDSKGKVIGFILRTSPRLDHFNGYQGPLDVLIVLSPNQRTILGLKLRSTYDNEPYVDYIRDDGKYLKVFDGWDVGRVAAVDFDQEGIEGVSGATITSWAIAESTRQRISQFIDDRQENQHAAASRENQGWTANDAGVIGMVVAAMVISFSRLRGNHRLRILWQILVVAYIGIVSGQLVSQALFAGWAKAGVPWQSSIGLAVIGLAALAVPWGSGHQLYCHHLCPHGVLQQWLLNIRRKRGWKIYTLPTRGNRVLRLLPWLLLLFTLASLFYGMSIDLANLEPFNAWILGAAGGASFLIAVLGLGISAFSPMAYCRYGCPTGALLGFLRSRGASDAFGVREIWAIVFLLIGALMSYFL